MRVLTEMETGAVVGGHINGIGGQYSLQGNDNLDANKLVRTSCGAGNAARVSVTQTVTGRSVQVGRSGGSGSGRSVTTEVNIECNTGSGSSGSDSGSNGSDGDSGGDSGGSDSGSDS